MSDTSMAIALARQGKPFTGLAYDGDDTVRAGVVIEALNNARLAGNSLLLFQHTGHQEYRAQKVADAVDAAQRIIEGMAVDNESFEFTVTAIENDECIKRLDIRLKE